MNRLKERDPKASLASWAFRFVGSYPRILTVLSGMVYQEHLEDNLRTFKDFKYLTDEEKEFLGTEIAGIMARFPTINCNDCKYCMPCPYGVDIPGIFKHYNECVNEGETWRGSIITIGISLLSSSSYRYSALTLRWPSACFQSK